jgi:hypothetical protein
MFDMNDILERLRNGQSVDAIASELTDAINKANSTYQAELAAKEAAEKQKAETITVCCDSIADYVMHYLETAHPDLLKEIAEIDEDFEITGDHVKEFLEHSVVAIGPMLKVAKVFGVEKEEDEMEEIAFTGKPIFNPVTTTKAETDENLDKVFDKFFKVYGI